MNTPTAIEKNDAPVVRIRTRKAPLCYSRRQDVTPSDTVGAHGRNVLLTLGVVTSAAVFAVAYGGWML